MLQNKRDVYEKYGFPRKLNLAGCTYAYEASGATWMLYVCKSGRSIVAKVMPSPSSKSYQKGWIQNKNGAQSLRRLQSLSLMPKVHSHDDYQFTNKWGDKD